MSQIIVAGAGHGGLVAAIKLAKLGHKVMVFEKSAKETLGLPQKDVFDSDTFEYTDLPCPDSLSFGKNRLTFISAGESTAPLSLPAPEEDAIIMERKILIKHLLELAEESGVRLIYSCRVHSPILLGCRVAGIRTDSGDFYGDLIIDSCGVDSPLRAGLPDYMNVNREIKKNDVVYTYRAYFERDMTAPSPESNFNIILKDDGAVGFSWVVTENDCVDVLICHFSPLDNEQVLKKLQEIACENPHMSQNFIRGGLYLKIPVCQPLGVLVADGYAAVGDSAFMTYAIKGSGISYSMKAGKMLADAVENDVNGFYNTETLWEYEKRFFKEIGFTAGRLAILKNMLTYFTAKEIDDLFSAGIFTTEDLSQIMTNKLDNLFGAAGRALIKEKIKMIRENAVLKEKLSNLAIWMGKLAVTETYFPNKYNRKDVQKWFDKYNEFFDNIRKE